MRRPNSSINIHIDLTNNFYESRCCETIINHQTLRVQQNLHIENRKFIRIYPKRRVSVGEDTRGLTMEDLLGRRGLFWPLFSLDRDIIPHGRFRSVDVVLLRPPFGLVPLRPARTSVRGRFLARATHAAFFSLPPTTNARQRGTVDTCVYVRVVRGNTPYCYVSILCLAVWWRTTRAALAGIVPPEHGPLFRGQGFPSVAEVRGFVRVRGIFVCM